MRYYALGLMSGSSLDGLDIAYAALDWRDGHLLDWRLLVADTLPFSEQWQARLLHLPQQDALTFAKTHVYFGRYMADLVQAFRQRHRPARIDFIASHGHTIFHQPDKYLTTQIGDGAALSALTGLPVICDFRTMDVALGGEGAPLAPLADRYLFAGYDFYLNIGGIANLSSNSTGDWIGFDVCPANQVLNLLAQQVGAEYDHNGDLARQGQVLEPLLQRVRDFDFYRKSYPKSLGNEWIRAHVLPIYLEYEGRVEDKLATACAHIALELAQSIQRILTNSPSPKTSPKLLATGGGAFNGYLMERLRASLPAVELVVPAPEIVQFKEALLMALLGVLRLNQTPNSLRSITRAKRDTVNGAIYGAL